MVCGLTRGLVPRLIASATLARFLRLVCGFGCVRVCGCGRNVLRCGVLFPLRKIPISATVGSGLFDMSLRAVRMLLGAGLLGRSIRGVGVLGVRVLGVRVLGVVRLQAEETRQAALLRHDSLASLGYRDRLLNTGGRLLRWCLSRSAAGGPLVQKVRSHIKTSCTGMYILPA